MVNKERTLSIPVPKIEPHFLLYPSELTLQWVVQSGSGRLTSFERLLQAIEALVKLPLGIHVYFRREK